MPRALRIQTADLIRHVMARGNGRMAIFLDDRDYREFMRLFREVIEDFKLECWNYCVMPNHYHATIRPTLPNISKAIQCLNSRYARWWNWRYTKVGHVFQGRFKAQIVQRDGYALALSRYVALNPVRAQLVERPEEWPWSSYGAATGQCSAPSFLSSDATLSLFGDADRATLQKRFAKFVLARCEDGTSDDRIRSSDRVLGDAHFKACIRDAPRGQASATGNPSQTVA
jgi:putative transposase